MGSVGERRRDPAEMPRQRPAAGPDEVTVDRKRSGSQLVSWRPGVNDSPTPAAGRLLKPLIDITLLLHQVGIDLLVVLGQVPDLRRRSRRDIGDERVKERIRGHVWRERIWSPRTDVRRRIVPSHRFED
jgi:hypothetical protein